MVKVPLLDVLEPPIECPGLTGVGIWKVGPLEEVLDIHFTVINIRSILRVCQSDKSVAVKDRIPAAPPMSADHPHPVEEIHPPSIGVIYKTSAAYR